MPRAKESPVEEQTKERVHEVIQKLCTDVLEGKTRNDTTWLDAIANLYNAVK